MYPIKKFYKKSNTNGIDLSQYPISEELFLPLYFFNLGFTVEYYKTFFTCFYLMLRLVSKSTLPYLQLILAMIER